MPNTYYSGKMGSITIGGNTYPIETWTLSSEVNPVEVSNFTIIGQQAYLPGLAGGSIEASGPLTSAGTPDDAGTYAIPDRPNAGEYASFVLGVATGFSYTVVALTDTIEITNDVKGRPTLNVTATISPNPDTV